MNRIIRLIFLVLTIISCRVYAVENEVIPPPVDENIAPTDVTTSVPIHPILPQHHRYYRQGCRSHRYTNRYSSAYYVWPGCCSGVLYNTMILQPCGCNCDCCGLISYDLSMLPEYRYFDHWGYHPCI